VTVRIETDRLLLREWREGDWVDLHRAYSDPEVMRWLAEGGTLDVETTAFVVGRMHAHWQQLGYGLFATIVKETGELIGRVGLMRHPDWPVDEHKVEVGWTLQRSAWGNGYATEGALASLQFAFERIGFERIFSMTDPKNERSQSVMKKCGLTYQGEVEFHGYRDVYYAIDRSDWPPSGVTLPSMHIREE